jgi:mannitol/fructose-specific phosphotransferase system IIA component
MTPAEREQFRQRVISFASTMLGLAADLPIDCVIVMRHRDENHVSFAANIPHEQVEHLLALAVIAVALSPPDHYEQLHRPQ